MNSPGFTDSKSKIISCIKKFRSAGSVILPNAKPDLAEKIEYPSLNEEELLSGFIEELKALEVDSYVEYSPENVRERLRSLIHGKSILSWEPQSLPYDLGTILEKENVIYGRDEITVQTKAEIGLTGCDAAIAETGSLVLVQKKGQPKTASLLPFVHVAVVKKSEIYFSMGEFFVKDGKEAAGSPCVNIITGPSRTADIEQTLTIGVHGPGKVIVVIGP